MAKKKVPHQAKASRPEAPQQPEPNRNSNHISAATATISMDDPSDKLRSLKSLNSRLLKETYERRQQMDSLVHAKESLETELTRSSMEKKALESEVNRASEENVGLELEKGVFSVFVETQMSQMGVELDGFVREKVEIERVKSEKESEIGSLKREVDELTGSLENERDKLSRVCRERDFLRKDFDSLVQEANVLKEKVMDSEKRERLMKDELEKLIMQCKGLMEESEERKRSLETLKREKALAERKLLESEKLIEKFKIEAELILSEKNETERKKSGLEVQIGVLEKEVGQKNEIEVDLRREVEVLRVKILESEKFMGESMKEMELEIMSLKKGNGEKEQNIEKLQSQFYEVELALKMATMERHDKQLRIEELIREKNEIEEAKVNQENEIVALHNEVGELRDALFAVRTSNRELEEKNEQLLSEVSHFRDSLDSISLQRNEAQKAFDEEKKNIENLKLVISEKEKKIVETMEQLVSLRDGHENLLGKTQATESQLESLAKERDATRKSLLEAQSRMEEWRAKAESAGINSKRVLTMLKKTTAMVLSAQSEHGSNSKKVVPINEQKLDDEIQPYTAEFEAIQNAFNSKEKMMEDMKQQVEFLKRSAEEAHKKKSLWTLITSATTIFAAASVAYAAKAR